MPTATAPVPATLPPPRKHRIAELDAALLIPERITAPAPVLEAAAAARAAFETYAEALTAYREAEQDVEDAPALDAAADREALNRGDDLPAPTIEATRKALGEANRRKVAADQLARAAIYRQADVMREHYGEWVEQQRQAIGERVGVIRELVDRLHDEFAGLRADEALADALAGFDGQAGNWRYSVPRTDRQEHQRDRAHATLKARLTHRHQAQIESDDLDLLLAALVKLADDATPGDVG